MWGFSTGVSDLRNMMFSDVTTPVPNMSFLRLQSSVKNTNTDKAELLDDLKIRRLSSLCSDIIRFDGDQ